MKPLRESCRWTTTWRLAALPVAALLLAAAGCGGPQGPEVVVYCALDKEFSEPILDDFEKESGVRVLANYDIESTKTVGLANRLIREKSRPQCDVFWNNEILHSLRLQREGLLETYHSPAAEPFPETFRAADGAWHGLAARARVLLVNTDLVQKEDYPTSVRDLADPKWKGKIGMAKPLFGTTATHAAVLFAEWGEEEAKEFFADVQQNVQVMSGNKQVALAVAGGQLAWGITDTDDAIIERDDSRPVEIVFPDQAEGQRGALYIPNTLCIIKGGPNGEQARALVDHLLGPDVERRLAEGRSAQFPLNPNVQVRSRAQGQQPVRWMEVDFQAAADHWEQAAEFLNDTFN